MLTSKRNWLFICALTVLAPCLPLFAKTFLLDWVNHTWMINYCARYFTHHLAFPSVYNTQQLIGMAYPVFYGCLFFPFMGLLSTVFDSNVTVRILAIALFAGQFALLYRTLMRFTSDRSETVSLLPPGSAAIPAAPETTGSLPVPAGSRRSQELCAPHCESLADANGNGIGARAFAFTISTLVIWAIYPLTNLYHRAAIPEFFATGLLTCACIGWVRALSAPSERALKLWCNFTVLCLCASAGTHPITAIYGIVFFITLIPLGLILRPTHSWQKLAVAMLVPALIATACMAPWAVSAAKYNRKFQIAQSFHVIGFYRKTIDNWALRLTPIPVPYRFLAADAQIENMGTRHLDAEINTPLLLAFLGIVFALWRRRSIDKRLAVALAVTAAAAAWVANGSVTSTFDKLGHIARSIQFSYRLVTYCNLSLLAGLLLAVMYNARNNDVRPLLQPRFAAALLGLSGLGLLFKLGFTLYLRPIEPYVFAWQRPDAALLQLPKEFYGSLSYSMPALLPSLSLEQAKLIQPIKLQPGEGADFGSVKPVALRAAAEFIGTNVQESVFNKILVNGNQLPAQNLKAYDSLFVLSGLKPCTLSYAFEPDSLWSLLNKCAFPLFLIWIGATLLITLVTAQISRKTLAAPLTQPANERLSEPEIAH